MTKHELFHSWAYGMFVHYGLYSIPERGEWLRCNERMPLDEYFRLKDEFHLQPRIARGWGSLARRAGMKYMCLTTRRHDGFCVGDALVRECCEACREFGLGAGEGQGRHSLGRGSVHGEARLGEPGQRRRLQHPVGNRSGQTLQLSPDQRDRGA